MGKLYMLIINIDVNPFEASTLVGENLEMFHKKFTHKEGIQGLAIEEESYENFYDPNHYG